jgi:hypothetical protein
MGSTSDTTPNASASMGDMIRSTLMTGHMSRHDFIWTICGYWKFLILQSRRIFKGRPGYSFTVLYGHTFTRLWAKRLLAIIDKGGGMSDCVIENNGKLRRELLRHLWKMQFDSKEQLRRNKKLAKSKKKTRELFKWVSKSIPSAVVANDA